MRTLGVSKVSSFFSGVNQGDGGGDASPRLACVSACGVFVDD